MHISLGTGSTVVQLGVVVVVADDLRVELEPLLPRPAVVLV